MQAVKCKKQIKCSQISDSRAFVWTAPYAWDEPTLNPLRLQLQIPGGTSATYSLDRLEEGEQLQYENFIYLIATPTFDRYTQEDRVGMQKSGLMKLERDCR
jgi:hypothetical protein